MKPAKQQYTKWIINFYTSLRWLSSPKDIKNGFFSCCIIKSSLELRPFQLFWINIWPITPPSEFPGPSKRILSGQNSLSPTDIAFEKLKKSYICFPRVYSKSFLTSVLYGLQISPFPSMIGMEGFWKICGEIDLRALFEIEFNKGVWKEEWNGIWNG